MLIGIVTHCSYASVGQPLPKQQLFPELNPEQTIEQCLRFFCLSCTSLIWHYHLFEITFLFTSSQDLNLSMSGKLNQSEMQPNWTWWTFTFLTSQWSNNAREGFNMLGLNLLNCCRVTFLPISTAARGKLNFTLNCTFSVHSLGFWHVLASYWSLKTRLNRPPSLWRLPIKRGWTKYIHPRQVRGFDQKKSSYSSS